MVGCVGVGWVQRNGTVVASEKRHASDPMTRSDSSAERERVARSSPATAIIFPALRHYAKSIKAARGDPVTLR